MAQPRVRVRGRSIVAVVASSVLLTGLMVGVAQGPAVAGPVTTVRGSACGYYVNVGLFGGPQNLRGCGQTAGGTASASPFVNLTSNGSNSPQSATDSDGAAGVYGPATIFGGIWPVNVAAAPPSGPMAASTSGTPAGGTVTSSADISLYTPPGNSVTCATGYTGPCYAPGGFGPSPVEGDSLHVVCTANDTSVTGSTTIVNGILSKATDSGGSPLDQEAIPTNPPPNYTKSGVITNVGDVFTVVFNQQVWNSDGSLTVNAVHMYLFGPTAVGEVVKGSATCGTSPHPTAPADTLAPACGTVVVAPNGPDDPTPKSPRTELIGIFDAGGLQSVSNIQVTNGAVSVGQPASTFSYLHFVPGQTGPLPITATRTSAAESQGLPLVWSFDATDVAGNTAHCQGLGYDRTPTISVGDIRVNEGNSATTPATFTVTRTGNVATNSTVTVKTTNGTASAAAGDYTTLSAAPLTFGLGETTKTVTVDVNGDTLPEKNETFNLVLSAPSAGTVLGDATGVATIMDDDAPPTFSVNNVNVAEGNVGTTNATFTVTRSRNTTGTNTVKVHTTGGTATPSTAATGTPDYTAVPLTTLTFNPGDTTQTVNVSINGDTTVEPNETFNLALSAPTPTGTALADATGTATITNDDSATAPPSGKFLSVSDPWVIEGDSGTTTATFTVTRSGDTTGTASASYATGAGNATAGTDYVATSGTVSFADGETSKTVDVTVNGDTAVEANETFNLTLSGQSAGTVLADAAGTATIMNDDLAPNLAVSNLQVVEGDAGTTAAVFTVTRSGNTDAASSAHYTTSGGTAVAGSDYTAASGTVSFAPGETTQTVSVDVIGDTVVEVNETFNLVLSLPVGATLADASGTATIINDDPFPTLSISDVSASEGNSGTTPFVFTFTRSGNTGATSTVKYKTGNFGATAPTDYTPIALTTLTFAPGETVKTVTVTVNGDTIVEPDEVFNLVLSSPTGLSIPPADASCQLEGSVPCTVTGTIVNDD